MDRFGDDLTEEILQYLTLEDKIRLECVSKQWQRCVYQRQYVLELDLCCDETQNTLNRILRIECNDGIELVKKCLESVLKKCPNIMEASFGYPYADSEVLSMIGLYCPNIRSMKYSDINNDIKTMDYFRINGHKLEELGIYGKNKEIENYLKFCQNLRKFFIHEVLSLITEDNEVLPKLEQIEKNSFKRR